MGYAIYWVDKHRRFGGYGVPAQCEHPDCRRRIHRGLAFLCGSEPGGDETGCGLYFCEKHRLGVGLCERCAKGKRPFRAKPDTKVWMRHLLKNRTWRQWRDENPREVSAIRRRLLAMS